MKIKLDENLPHRLVETLSQKGHQVDTVMDEGLKGDDDRSIWKASQSDGRFLITQDLDFSDIRTFKPGTHQGCLLVRLKFPGRQALFDFILSLFEKEDVESWRGCLVVATDKKIRIRHSA